MSLGPDGLCRECTNFSAAEHIVYATAELLSVEFENGILAMEFAAPAAGEAILQLAAPARSARSLPPESRPSSTGTTRLCALA